jgi:hypothetical protein
MFERVHAFRRCAACEQEASIAELIKRHTKDDRRLLPISLPNQHVTVFEPVIKLGKSGGAGLALDPQHPVSTNRQFEVMAGLVSTADFPGSEKLGYRRFDANALPTRTEPAHGVGPMSGTGAPPTAAIGL